MSYRSVAAAAAVARSQTQEFIATYATGETGRICGSSEHDARREAERVAKYRKTVVISVVRK